MPAYIGREVAFTWNDEEIPGVQEKNVSCNGEPIDVSADESAGWRELLDTDGESAVSISLTGVTKSTQLKADWFAGTRTRDVELTYPDGGVLSGSFRMVSFQQGMGYKAGVTFQAELQSTGAVIYTAPSGS
ncbi:MAG: hypothetical protein H6883_07245 [Rhodobiaceae bacterium]|nr:hypothetical protein [Rhodobiaceae bacterium]MCC0055915.1 hypothetical protein [Rhodobiaceae bacterium]